MRPTVPSLERFCAIYMDLQDNFPNSRELPHVVDIREGHEKILAELCSQEQRQNIVRLTSSWDSGEYLFRIKVGEVIQGTAHPHDFVVVKEDKHLDLLFIDPENTVGDRNLLRPKIGNLMGVRVGQDEFKTSIAILRFRATDDLTILDPHIFHMPQQTEAAKQMLGGLRLPNFLIGHEQQIVFRLFVSSDFADLQCRHEDQRHMVQFLRGDFTDTWLQSKVHLQQIILGRFIKFLEEGKFKKRKKSQP